MERILPIEQRLQLLDSLDVYHRGTMDPGKLRGIELALHRGQSLAHHPRTFSRMKMNVLIVSFYPVDLVNIQKRNPPVGLDDESVQIRLPGADPFQERSDLPAAIFLLAGLEPLFG